MQITKIKLMKLIRSRSVRITFLKKSKICINDPDLFEILIDLVLSRNYVYCNNCDALLTKYIGSTSHLNEHCRSLKHLLKRFQLSNIGLSTAIKEDSSIQNQHGQENEILDGIWF